MPSRILENLAIQRWVNGGDGLGVVDEGPMQGLVVFVPKTVPGDRVDVELLVKKKRWAKGVVRRLVEPSTQRIPSACSVQDACGGCPWMRGEVALQRTELHEILKAEIKKRIRRGHPDADILVPAVRAGGSLGYRNRLRLAYRVDMAGRVSLGFRRHRSDTIVDIEECVVALEEINAGLPALKRELSGRTQEEGEVRLLGFGGKLSGQVEPSRGRPATWGEPIVEVDIGHASLPLPPTAFIQGNAEVATLMAEHVEDWARRSGGKVAVELFCGAGTFTVPMLRAGYEVTGYDIADDCGEAFAAVTGPFGQANFRQQDLLGLTPFPENPPARPDVVILDPPRSGAGEVLDWVASCGAKQVLMVSCDIATGLRDTALLMDAGFRCVTIQSYDLFPHTGHQELVIELIR